MPKKRPGVQGNALLEYAVPTAILIIGAGILTTVMDTQKLMGEYFMSASGNTSGSLKGTTFEVEEVGKGIGGATGTGSGGFSTPFATVTDGRGGAPRIVMPTTAAVAATPLGGATGAATVPLATVPLATVTGTSGARAGSGSSSPTTVGGSNGGPLAPPSSTVLPSTTINTNSTF